MAYKNDLQLAYSGREIALQRIRIIDSTVFTNQAERKYSEARRTKYQRLLEKSDEKISSLKNRITEDIALKKRQLDEHKEEHNHVDTRYKLGKISLQEREKQHNMLQKKYDQVKQEAVELDRLLQASKSSEIGGQVVIDIDKEVDDYGNINRKAAGVSIPSDIKMPNINAVPHVNVPSGISTQERNLSPGNKISLVGAIGGIIAIFLPWFVTGYGVRSASLYGVSQKLNQALFNPYSPYNLLYSSPDDTFILQILACCWLILLLLLVVCGYFSIKGRGAVTHIGIGTILFVVLLFMLFFTNTAASAGFGFGFYTALICSLLLIVGGIIEGVGH